MSTDRISVFEAMASDQPDNEMVWYGLASEYMKLERWPEAVSALRRVVEIKPDYTAAYQLLGTALLNEGKVQEARTAWGTGIAVADRTGAWKARQHMEGLLEGTQAQAGFCAEE